MKKLHIRATARLLAMSGAFFAMLVSLAVFGVVSATPRILTITNTNDSGPGSLRQAILDAQPNEEIRFAPALSGQTILLTSGELQLNKRLVIDGSDAPTLTISAGQNSRVVFVNGAAATVRNLILAHGDGTGMTYTPANGYGGCIYATSSAGFNLEHVEVRDCAAQFGGGGIANAFSTLACDDCYLHDNKVLHIQGSGGAVHNFAGFGLASTVSISGSQIISNTAMNGGAVMNDGNGDPARVTVFASMVSGNRAGGSGGAFFNIARVPTQVRQSMTRSLADAGSMPSPAYSTLPDSGKPLDFVRDARLSLDRTYVLGNAAAVSCGGICNAGSLDILNTMISANKAITGGAILNGDQMLVDWTTLAYNEADFGNAIAYSDVFNVGARIEVNNSLFWNPESGVSRQHASQTDNPCAADEGVGTTEVTGEANSVDSVACLITFTGLVGNPAFGMIPPPWLVPALGPDNDIDDKNQNHRPGDKDGIGKESLPPQAPGMQGHERSLTIQKIVEPESTEKFHFNVVTDRLRWTHSGRLHLSEYNLGHGYLLGLSFVEDILVREDADKPYTVSYECNSPAVEIEGNQLVIKALNDTNDPTAVTCVVRNIQKGSLTVMKTIPAAVEPPAGLFFFDLERNGTLLETFNVTPNANGVTRKLAPDQYVIRETNIPSGWEVEDIVCNASDFIYPGPIDPNAVLVNLKPGEDVTCTFANRLGPTPTPSPTPSPSPTPTATPGEPIIDPNGPDYFPIGIEVNQAIQNMENDVVLIADKATTVRVFVGRDPKDPPTRVLLEGVLHGTRDGVSLPGSPLSSKWLVNPRRSIDEPARANERKSLVFDLPQTWLHTGNTELTVEINPDFIPRERDYENNKLTVKRPFHRTPPVVLNLVFVEQEGFNKAHILSDFVPALRFMRDTYPTHRVKYYDMGYRQAKALNSLDGQKALFAQLEELDSYHEEEEERAVWVGLVHADMNTNTAEEGDVLGRAPYNSQQAMVKPNQGTLAHEVGHTFNRKHVACGGPGDIDPAYPYNPAKLSRGGPPDHWGFRPLETKKQRVKDPNYYSDFMTYCEPEWVSDYTYEAIWEYILTHFGKGGSSTGQARNDQVDPVVRVVGAINLDGPSASFDRAYRVMDGTPLDEGAEGDFVLQLVDSGGTVIYDRHFDPIVLSDAESDSIRPFSVLAPLIPDTQSLRVKRNEIILASYAISDNPPQVTVLSPNGGESLVAPFTIAWTASDPDSDLMTYAIQYSPDNGASWQAVAVQLTDTSFEMDSSRLPGGQQALIRVIANDGYHSAWDESDKVFAVGMKEPQVMIIDPQHTQTISPQAAAYLSGYGFDPEDGPLDDEAFSWTSDRDGDLGIGADQLVYLSPDWHTITLTVTDSDGNEASDSVEVFVGNRVYLPTILK